jgi:hypothetical protein
VIKKSIFTYVLATLAAGGLSAQSAVITYVVQPMSATASTEPHSDRLANETRNGSGVTGASLVNTRDPIPSPWPNHNTDNKSGWFSDIDTIANHSITYNLGGKYTLFGMNIWNWNYNGGGTQTDDGIKDVIVRFSLDGVDYASIPSQSFIFVEAPGSNYEGDFFSLSSAVYAQYVQFDIQSTFEHSSGQSGRAALAETRFAAFETVPEPSSFLLIAVGSMVVLFRRRFMRA